MTDKQWETVITNEDSKPLEGYEFHPDYEYLEITSYLTPPNHKEFIAGIQLTINHE